ncbi:hypothetical protein HMSSN139_14730 [Paenibacillus sp. HMSSN-139]|nr:hypothetical protein HMSSN139_14730 [Paenibacillus sp. HMSSN-139]
MAAKSKISLPQLSADLTPADWDVVLGDEDHELVGATVAGASYEHGVMEKCILSKVVLRGCSFVGTVFERMDMTDVVLENCDLSNAVLEKSHHPSGAFQGLQVDGAESVQNQCRLRDV